MGLHFFIGIGLFKNWILLKKAFWKSETILLQEKPIFLSLAVKIIFSNFSAVQTKHGSNKLMGKKGAKNLDYWQNDSKVGKRYGSLFKV